MKGFISVEIPTKKYIKAYILSELGDPAVLAKNHFISLKLHDLLQHEQNQKMTEFSTRYDTKMKIFINKDLHMKRGAFLNHDNIKNFNRYIEKVVKDKFYFLMDSSSIHFLTLKRTFLRCAKDLPLILKHGLMTACAKIIKATEKGLLLLEQPFDQNGQKLPVPRTGINSPVLYELVFPQSVSTNQCA